MKAMSKAFWFRWLRSVMVVGVLAWTVIGAAQDTAKSAQTSSPWSVQSPSAQPSSAQPSSAQSSTQSPDQSVTDSIRELRDQVRELQAVVAGMHSDWQRSRAETSELRRELDEVRAGSTPHDVILKNAVAKSEITNSGAAASLEGNSQYSPQNQSQDQYQSEDQKKSEHAASLEEEYQLLSGKVDDQYQTKVESASKYRLRLSGIVLMNLVSNRGTVDSIDLPTLAYPNPAGGSGGSFGATLRQSEIGLEAFGPSVAGAKTRADVQLDMAGGFASVPNGVNSGFVRLRTATMRMDWTNTSVVVGQDGLFFSPGSPTSFASLAIPALSYAGNLWSWTPQVRVEHRVALGDESSLLFQGGILDPVSGELPVPVAGSYRQPGPGEESRQPAYATRVAWTRNVFGQPLRVGLAGYLSPQDYGFNRTVTGWAGMTDVELPLSRQFSLSGELFRGKGLGGLYGGVGRSAVFSGDPASANTEVRGLNSVGGWAQLKFRPANKWEFNAAFGMDNPYAADLKFFPFSPVYGDPLARNRATFGNMIYRPRSDLLFSAEYRYFTTYSLVNGMNNAGQLNLMMGVLF
jgi:hypothetical protein